MAPLLLLLLAPLAASAELLGDADVLLQVASKPQSGALEPPGGVELAAPTKVLVFWALSAKPTTRELVRANVERLRSLEAASRNLNVKVFFAHYDGEEGAEAWRNATGDEWYGRNVDFASYEAGIKFSLAKRLLLNGTEFEGYDWFWVLDEDADFSRMSLAAFFGDAEASEALIVAPSIVFKEEEQSGLPGGALAMRREVAESGCQPKDGKCKFQAPVAHCRYRIVNFVEVSFPMLQPRAFAAVLPMRELVHDRTVWGLDHVWCQLPARLLVGVQKNKTCAIIDEAPVVHRNFRTLPKWSRTQEQLKEQFKDPTKFFAENMDIRNWMAQERVKHAYKGDYMDKYEEYGCASP